MDPYLILKISSDATDEQVRQAYRDCMRPFMMKDPGELTASDRRMMEDIDRAYDEIVSMRQSNGGYSGGQGADYSAIRQLIRKKRLDDAQTRLNSVRENARTAEWYFLQGKIQERRGWFNTALDSYAAAARMEPSNPEYNEAYENMANKRSAGQNNGYSRNRSSSSGSSGGCCDRDDCCDICGSLALTNCICECCDGDDNFCCCC